MWAIVWSPNWFANKKSHSLHNYNHVRNMDKVEESQQMLRLNKRLKLENATSIAKR
jgi:hypothetical protein